MTPEELFEYKQLVQMLRLKSPRVNIEFGVNDVICMIAQLQIALRHPGNRSRAAFAAWKAKEFMISFLESIQPGLAPFLRKGDGSYFDELRENERRRRHNGGGNIVLPGGN